MEYAKGHHKPEFIETCKIIVRDGSCEYENCDDCPGSRKYNDEKGCAENGWLNYEKFRQNAQAYINKHETTTTTKPTPKPTPTPTTPDHIQKRLNALESAYKDFETSVRHKREELTRTIQEREIAKAAWNAARKKAKEYTK
jgi:hypothetical protein